MKSLSKKVIFSIALLLAIGFLIYLEFNVRTSLMYVFEIRLHRVITAICSGIILSLSGLLLQIIFRNPLAGPYLTAAIPGSYLAITIGLILLPNTGLLQILGLKLLAMLGGMAVMLVQLFIFKRFNSISLLLLFGVVMGYFISGITELIIGLGNKEELQRIVYWSFGSFDSVYGNQIISICLASLVSIVFVWFIRKKLDIYSIGDELSINAGLPIRKFRFYVLLFAGGLAGFITSYCGPISFVGMIAPQFARLIVGSQSVKETIGLTILSGIVFCLLADVTSHYLIINTQLGLNGMLAIFGAPVILYTLIKQRV